MEKSKTPTAKLPVFQFDDSYGTPCELRKSIKNNFVWLGIADKDCHVVGPRMMHLSRDQVAQLLPLLTEFVRVGIL